MIGILGNIVENKVILVESEAHWCTPASLREIRYFLGKCCVRTNHSEEMTPRGRGM